MNSFASPKKQLVREQLRWIERRRFRTIQSVSSHFGHIAVTRALQADGLPCSLTAAETDPLEEFEREDLSLERLAEEMILREARTVSALRHNVSRYKSHVEEQLLFGAGTAGQDAGRSFLALTQPGAPRRGASTAEAVQAIAELLYLGTPDDRNAFLILRARGTSTIHHARSAYCGPWSGLKADVPFLCEVRARWMEGILEIVAPHTVLSSSSFFETGSRYGLDHISLRPGHAES